MANISKEAALRYHEEGRPGKIEVRPTKPYQTQNDLSLAYSPGVAFPCLEIQADKDNAYRYTDKRNLIAVISNGTAVLGLGDIGADGAKPVMEGKGLLFKIYGGVDVFDIEVNEKDPEKFCEAVEKIAPTFGGINLEDIKAPECFYIEERLKKSLDIPVMHDDQHGTAIISAAGLLNALEVNGKDISKVKLVVNGAGAAAISCTKLYMAFGIRKENIVMVDSKGVISTSRTDLNEQKKFFATERTDIHTLAEAMVGADIFLGLSKGGVVNGEMVKSMAKDPIVFALANPEPEISYEEAMASRPDVLMATGRSDYPNQINNVIGFPYIFRGALDVQAKCINEQMKQAAARAIAAIAHLPVPDIVNDVYHINNLTFGKDYFIPKPVDPRLITEVSAAVAKAAVDSGVARKPIVDWEGYKADLKELAGQESKLTRGFHDAARSHKQKVVFVEGVHPTMLKAAVAAKEEGICDPILLGGRNAIAELAAELELNIEGIEIVDIRCNGEAGRRDRYASILAKKHQRCGYTIEEAVDKMFSRTYFGMMMVETGEADALITGVHTTYNYTVKAAREVVGIRPGYKNFATMHIINSRAKGTTFIADTMINSNPSTEDLVELAELCRDNVTWFNQKPCIAMVSHSNFGSDHKSEEAVKMHKAVEILHEKYPEMMVDGEIELDYALNMKVRDERWPFTKIKGQKVNTLIFPNLSSARSSYKMLKSMQDNVEIIGPIQMGLNKSIHFVDLESSVHDILDVTAIAVMDAFIKKETAAK